MSTGTVGVLWISQEIADELSSIGTTKGANLSGKTVRFLVDNLTLFKGKGQEVVLRIHPPLEGDLKEALQEITKLGEGTHILDSEKLRELKQRFPDAFSDDPNLRHRLTDSEVVKGLVRSIKPPAEGVE